jgi:hypothetical protein
MMAARGLRQNTECRLANIDGMPKHCLNWVASESRYLLELLLSSRLDTELCKRLSMHLLLKEKFVVNSYPSATLLWLLMHVVAAPLVTCCLSQALHSKTVNKIVYP